MNLKKMLIPVALMASTLAPLAASANERSYYDNDGYRREGRYYGNGNPYYSGGRYHNAGQRWIPGHYEQVWIPQQCFARQSWYGERVRCQPGYYDNRWVPGRFVAAW